MLAKPFNILNTAHEFSANKIKLALSQIPFADAKIPLYFKDITVKELVYYGLFITATHGAHVVFKPLFDDPAAYIFTFIVGSLLQGNPYCINQIRIENEFPNISLFAGGVNAFLGCKAFSFLNNSIGIIPGIIIEAALSSIVMCKLEKVIYNSAKSFISILNNETEDQKNISSCCCKN